MLNRIEAEIGESNVSVQQKLRGLRDTKLLEVNAEKMTYSSLLDMMIESRNVKLLSLGNSLYDFGFNNALNLSFL